jgi:general secretion pathway protein G
MELLLVMSILVIMGGMVTFAFLNIGTTATMDLTLTQIKTLEKACMTYKLTHQQFPNQLGDLVAVPAGMTQRQWRGPFLDSVTVPMDPWKNEYNYSKDELKNQVYIRSAGPDRQMNTADDIPDPQSTTS